MMIVLSPQKYNRINMRLLISQTYIITQEKHTLHRKSKPNPYVRIITPLPSPPALLLHSFSFSHTQQFIYQHKVLCQLQPFALCPEIIHPLRRYDDTACMQCMVCVHVRKSCSLERQHHTKLIIDNCRNLLT